MEITPAAAEGKPPYRYTWTTPLELSPHNPDIVYTGGQMLLRSLNRGSTWEEMSPDLTTNDAVKIAGQGHIMFCTITTISESPLRAGVIWIGTDDGRIWLTRDHGAHWIELTEKISSVGGPMDTWVSRIEASTHSEGTAYVTKSGYREDVFEPYIYRTEDFGKTWKDISGNLSDAPISVVFEDRINSNLLFVGNDIGVYFSLDGGKAWIPLKNNMPPVPIRDLLVHPREQDLVVGSYGRGVWVTNISPLQELTQEVLNSDFHLFRILDKPLSNRSQRARWGNYQMTGDAHYRTRNEPSGLQVYYYLKEKRDKPMELIVEDLDGKVLGKFKSETTAGIHRFVWPRREGKPGTYRITLTDGLKEITLKGILKSALTWPVGNPDDFR